MTTVYIFLNCKKELDFITLCLKETVIWYRFWKDISPVKFEIETARSVLVHVASSQLSQKV